MSDVPVDIENASSIEPSTSPEIKPDQVERYIDLAGDQLKRGEYEAAIELLRDKSRIEEFGLHFSEGSSRILVLKKAVTDDEIGKLSNRMAANSMFRTQAKTLDISYFFPMNVEVPNELYHEAALIHMEEWLHALQLQIGTLTGEKDIESDVALYMKHQQIPMTKAFLARYNREEAINRT